MLAVQNSERESGNWRRRRRYWDAYVGTLKYVSQTFPIETDSELHRGIREFDRLHMLNVLGLSHHHDHRQVGQRTGAMLRCHQRRAAQASPHSSFSYGCRPLRLTSSIKRRLAVTAVYILVEWIISQFRSACYVSGHII